MSFTRKMMLVFFIILSGSLFAEEKLSIDTKIEIKDALFGIGNLYVVDDKNLTITELDQILSSNPEAFKEVKKARVPFYAGMGFAVVGGSLIGWPIGYALSSGEDIDWMMVGTGAVSALIGQALALVADSYYEKGVLIFNE